MVLSLATHTCLRFNSPVTSWASLVWFGGEVFLKPNESNDESEGGGWSSEVLDEDKAPLDYDVTANGKYRCRDCGMLFDSLKEHDDHHRSVHGQAEPYLKQGMTM